MLIRYSKNNEGKAVKAAEVYTRKEHGIPLEKIDQEAVYICKKLRQGGFEAYIVGGAVRDLLNGKTPKDFDIATDAHPRSVKKVLPYSRIIGKRFRLVHVYFPGNKILEVATFRKGDAGDEANVFGTMEEDVRRRDFTLNALYYDPKDEYVIDFVGGVKDVRAKKLVNVIPLEKIFDEDPVRMLRAVKYATTSGFKIPWKIQWKIKDKTHLLKEISPSRLTEEFYKIITSGNAAKIFPAALKYRVLESILPRFALFLKSREGAGFDGVLKALDEWARTSEDKNRDEGFKILAKPLLTALDFQSFATTENFEELTLEVKNFFKPIVPPNREVDETLRELYKEWNIRAPRKRPPREHHHSDSEPLTHPTPEGEAKKPRKRNRRRRPKPTAAPM